MGQLDASEATQQTAVPVILPKRRRQVSFKSVARRWAQENPTKSALLIVTRYTHYGESQHRNGKFSIGGQVVTAGARWFVAVCGQVEKFTETDIYQSTWAALSRGCGRLPSFWQHANGICSDCGGVFLNPDLALVYVATENPLIYKGAWVCPACYDETLHLSPLRYFQHVKRTWDDSGEHVLVFGGVVFGSFPLEQVVKLHYDKNKG